MSFIATQDAKDRIRQTLDIVDVIGGYIPLERQGRIYKGLCPWHNDSNPSLQVNPERGSWKCWPCNLGGDIFSFVMKREGVSFPEALRLLADKAGITLASAGPRTKHGDPNDKKTLYEVMSWAERQFRECLRQAPEAAVARQYFADRRLTAGSLDTFQLGYAPESWQWLLDRARTAYAPAVLDAVGLVGHKQDTNRYYDFFRGRVIFPIHDPQGRTIAFGGRVLPGSDQERVGKYINTRETRLFSKTEQVYALNRARDAITRSRTVIVVEGYMDVIMCHQHGIQNTVAVMGTALGAKHIHLLKRYADRVTLLLDGDAAGQRRTNEVLQLFVAGEMDLRIATLPDELDPCEFLEERSADDFRAMIDGAVDAFEHAIRIQTQGLDLVRDTHQANRSLENLLSILAQAPRMTAETSTARLLRERQVIARLAREFRVEEPMLRQRLAELRVESPLPQRIDVPAAPASDEVTIRDLPPLEAELFEILVRHPLLVDVALVELPGEWLTQGASQRIWKAYESVVQRGESPEFARILGDLEEPHLQNLLVELDERAGSKEAFANLDAATRLKGLIEEVRYRFQAVERRQQLAVLEQKRVADAEELQILLQLREQERKRQGIPAPTDG
ncbi:MAG: DNA primase [Pirellulaceae bacterium]